MERDKQRQDAGRLTVQSASPRRVRGRRGFTLIELLLVMGIMALLLVMAVTSYQNIGRATQLDQSVTQLKFAMQFARQWAITNRVDTWVVFPTSIPGGEFAGMNDMNFRSYGIYTNPRTGASEQVREWTVLPTSVFFDPTESPTKNALVLANCRVPGASALPAALHGQPGIGFAPSGGLVAQITAPAPEIFLAEGFRAPDDGPTAQPRFLADQSVIHGVQIYRFTGLPQITRYGEN